MSSDELQEAVLEGDEPYRPGSARAALRHPEFRTMFFGSFLSNIGTWMQNVVLGAYAYELTGSSSFVGLIVFAQLGPMLLLPILGGYVADLFDRRRLLIILTIEQMAFAGLLAVLVTGAGPSRPALVAAVVGVGVGAGLYGPAFSALLPGLVGRQDLAGAISLNATQMNASRVLGPAIGGVLFAAVGPAWVFAGNAASYLFIIGALVRTQLPAVPKPPEDEPSGFRRLLVGFRVARRDRVVGTVLVTVTCFSFFSLPVVGQFAVVAADNLGIEPRSTAFGILYACFGAGAVAGSIGTGVLLSRRERLPLARVGLFGFAAMLSIFSLLRHAAPAYPTIFLLGTVYFVTITSFSTALQERLDDHERGRVMALWFMSWGGTVPVGNLVAGPVIEATAVTPVLLFGAAVAVLLAMGPVRAREAPGPLAPDPRPGSP